MLGQKRVQLSGWTLFFELKVESYREVREIREGKDFIRDIGVMGVIGVIKFPKFLNSLKTVDVFGVWWMDEGYRPSGG